MARIKDYFDLFRVYQRHGFDTCGEVPGVARIQSIDLKKFADESIMEIEPCFFRNIIRTHTYNYI
jgi:hypothetical protein